MTPIYQGGPTLGGHVLKWITDHLRVPSGPLYGRPLKMTMEQAAILLEWYRIDHNGELVYRRGSVRRPKGWGKSPLLAAVALAEFCGPVRFNGWAKPGVPRKGSPVNAPWVQIAAVSEDQTENTYSALYNMLSFNGGAAAEKLGVKLNRTELLLKGRPGRLEPVTAAFGTREGQPITFAVLDETHLWTPRNGGVKLAATLRRNAAKMGGRSFESTNAYRPGDRSVAEASHRASQKGQKGLLYESREGPWVDDLDDRAAVLESLQVAYGDASWVPLPRVYEEMRDADTTEADSRRFFLNQIVEDEDAYIPPRLWEAREAGSAKPGRGRPIAIGFDGSRFRDATALRGCDLESGRLFTIDIWEQPKDPAGRPVDGWEVPRDEVHGKVHESFAQWNVVRMYCDPPDWDSDIADWHGKYGTRVMAFYTRSNARMSPALQEFRKALQAGEVSHDGCEVASQHALNARLRVDIPVGAEDDTDRHIWKIRKPGLGLYIDATVADVLAWKARADGIAGGGLEPEPSKTLWTF